ncbi:uncharacterized protein ARMOST_16775 [Armillaria ostoyae]|uniref:Uncharacterized protein n=1 Tax=Armillaria ostoyae TaxID=47428 RepID=A0A284RX73_ARMOS|nr:uncharacterized protein ARMOST_16775 [Armillaria ostoyae]
MLAFSPGKEPAREAFRVEIMIGLESSLNMLDVNPSGFTEPTL